MLDVGHFFNRVFGPSTTKKSHYKVDFKQYRGIVSSSD